MWLWNNKVSLLRTRAALGAPQMQQAACHTKGHAATPKGQATGLGKGNGKSRSEMKAWGKQKAPEQMGTWGEYSHIRHITHQALPTSEAGRYIQIKQEKRFHLGNTAVRQQGWKVLPAGRTRYSNFHSTSAERRKKLWGTRLWIHWGPGTVTRSLLSKTAPMQWRKPRWKSWEIHTVTQHFWATCNNATRHKKGEEICVRLFLPETGYQDRIWCCCR